MFRDVLSLGCGVEGLETVCKSFRRRVWSFRVPLRVLWEVWGLRV